jgi:hypothetical protein
MHHRPMAGLMNASTLSTRQPKLRIHHPPSSAATSPPRPSNRATTRASPQPTSDRSRGISTPPDPVHVVEVHRATCGYSACHASSKPDPPDRLLAPSGKAAPLGARRGPAVQPPAVASSGAPTPASTPPSGSVPSNSSSDIPARSWRPPSTQTCPETDISNEQKPDFSKFLLQARCPSRCVMSNVPTGAAAGLTFDVANNMSATARMLLSTATLRSRNSRRP